VVVEEEDNALWPTLVERHGANRLGGGARVRQTRWYLQPSQRWLDNSGGERRSEVQQRRAEQRKEKRARQRLGALKDGRGVSGWHEQLARNTSKQEVTAGRAWKRPESHRR
jgi:hypothetical protein